MASVALTDRSVKGWKPDPSKRVEVPDSLVTGLYLVVTERGAKSWAVRYRFAGKTRKVTLGQYPALPLADARDQARDALLKVAKGADPALEKVVAAEVEREAREAEERARRDRFEHVAADFIEKYAKPRNRSWEDTERIFRVYVTPVWQGRPISSILRRDIRELLEQLAEERGPVMSNRTFAAIRKLFGWCAEREVIEINPAAGVKPVGTENDRDRILSDEEIVKAWAAWDAMGLPFGIISKLLLLTGQRRSEVAEMRWQDVDLERRVWTLPREAAKNDKAHEIPLSPMVVEIMQSIPIFVGQEEPAPAGKKESHTPAKRTLVFPAQRGGTGAASGFSNAKRQMDKLILTADREAEKKRGGDPEQVQPLENWTLHDLRRTAASGMARLGFQPHVVEKVLNHSTGTISGVAAVYNRHGYLEEKRQALEAWAIHVERLLHPVAAENVVKLRK